MTEPKRHLADVIKSEFGGEAAAAVAAPEPSGSDDMNRVYRFFQPTAERRRLDYEASQPAPAPKKPAGIAGLSDEQLEKIARVTRREIEKRDEDVSDIVPIGVGDEDEYDYYLPAYEEADEEDEDEDGYGESEGGFYS